MMYPEEVPHPRKSFYSTYVKRSFDIVLSGIALAVLSPIYLIIYLLELKYHGMPAIYSSKRPGKDGKIFNVYKFRSMTNERGEDGYLLSEEQRLTKFGKFLRKTSLDELPQIYNIFKGDMSIVGPRPLLIEYLPLYSPRHAMRHSVRPGLVCITKEQGPPTWGAQFENDIAYIQNISFITDVKMLVAVFAEVFKHAEYRTKDTRVPFNGHNLDDTRSKEEAGQAAHFDSLQ